MAVVGDYMAGGNDIQKYEMEITEMCHLSNSKIINALP